MERLIKNPEPSTRSVTSSNFLVLVGDYIFHLFCRCRHSRSVSEYPAYFGYQSRSCVQRQWLERQLGQRHLQRQRWHRSQPSRHLPRPLWKTHGWTTDQARYGILVAWLLFSSSSQLNDSIGFFLFDYNYYDHYNYRNYLNESYRTNAWELFGRGEIATRAKSERALAPPRLLPSRLRLNNSMPSLTASSVRSWLAPMNQNQISEPGL